MQKFTRALTREIEVGGERLAVTLSEEGLSVRVVGSRKTPYTMTWTAWLCACTKGREQGPDADEIAVSLKALRAGGKEPAAATTPTTPAAETPPQPAPAAARTDRLPGLLAGLDAWLSQHRHRFARGLLPGATRDELNALQSDLGHALPDELRTWLAWHNGQSPDVPGGFVQSWHLMSTQQIAQVKKELDKESSPNWHPAWIPFLDDDNQNYVCLDNRQPGYPVRECWRGRQEHAVVAESLTAWVETFVAGVEQGQYVEDPERGTFYKKT